MYRNCIKSKMINLAYFIKYQFYITEKNAKKNAKKKHLKNNIIIIYSKTFS